MREVNEMIGIQDEAVETKKKNKGFSLVELIIVIAIMAILVRVVGTQVLPYIEKSREAKDQQVISAICTSALTAFSSHAQDLTAGATYTITINTATTCTDVTGTGAATTDVANVITELGKLSSYATLTQVKDDFESKTANSSTAITIIYAADGTISVAATGSTIPVVKTK